MSLYHWDFLSRPHDKCPARQRRFLWKYKALHTEMASNLRLAAANA